MSVEAPERIWVERDPDTGEKRWFSIKGMGDTEYVRADKLEELATEKSAMDNHYRILQEDYAELLGRCEALTFREIELAAENEALRKLVDSAESIFINCSVTDGVCCCGDNMETHPSPMFCGHMPVDHGAYQVDLWLEARNAGGTDAG